MLAAYSPATTIPTLHLAHAPFHYSPPPAASLPQNFLFGPVWTVLYCCMGTASWFVWKKKGESTGVGSRACNLEGGVS